MLEEQLFDIVDRMHELMFKGFSAKERAQAFSLIVRMKNNIEKEFSE